MIASSTPSHIRNTPQEDFDCSWRSLAYEYASTLQPWLNHTQLVQIFDAAELAVLCNQTMHKSKVHHGHGSHHERKHGAGHAGANTIYVDAAAGSDTSGTGSVEAPLATLPAALDMSRKGGDGTSIVLREGTYYLSSTLELDTRDSGLTITSYEGETAIVSGGVELDGLEWTQAGGKFPDGVFVASVPSSISDIPALHHQGQRATVARYPNANPELDIFPLGYISTDTEWLAPEYKGEVCDSNLQCGVSKNITIPVDDAWHGMFQNFTVGQGGACDRYSPNYSPWCSGDFYLLRQFPEMHTRSPAGIWAEAMLPNSQNYGTDSHVGAKVHAWRPGHWYTWMFEVGDEVEPPVEVDTWAIHRASNAVSGLVPSPGSSTDSVSYLGDFDDMDACWAACNTTTNCGSFTFHEPTFPVPEWANGCYAITDGSWQDDTEEHVVSGRGPYSSGAGWRFVAGGHQGGEGSDEGGEFFVENVLEELDAANEFYYDIKNSMLYFYPNATGDATGDVGAKPDSTVVVPTLDTLISIKGTQDAPVKSVTISGIEFTATRPTYMDNRTNPSSGDWSLERSGALRMEGTEEVTVEGNMFQRLDSNAISINGYNQRTSIAKNEFVWLGQSAITSWGEIGMGNDGTGGSFPRYTSVTDNLVHEIGHLQKQSSFYFQAITAEATITGNIVYNIPRAGINFNDGFGGGAKVSNNLMFNTCRESGDHGAFNSWDRLPYLTTVADGVTATTVPAMNDVHNNFIVANYAADGGCLDNDDGSAYYSIHHNFCVFGGHKQNFDGHDKHSSNNVYVFPQVYGVKCIDEEMEGEDTGTSGPDGLPPVGYGESYQNNICILPNAGDPYVYSGGRFSDPDAYDAAIKLSNNTIYAPDASVTVTLSGDDGSFEDFQKAGFDPTSTVSGDMPSNEQILQWGRELLGM
mmetsp:Transcript_34287/g.79254  ORF Transcript_34287/g.79254 Transcript_34287/m.79254 type:complete len:919 (-) Transcript_34287:403-3159(-)